MYFRATFLGCTSVVHFWSALVVLIWPQTLFYNPIVPPLWILLESPMQWNSPTACRSPTYILMVTFDCEWFGCQQDTSIYKVNLIVQRGTKKCTKYELVIFGLFIVVCVFSILLTVNKIWRWLDSNHRSLVSKVTALPTEL